MTSCALLMMAYLTGENKVISSRELEKNINFSQQCIFNTGRRLKKHKLINTVAGPFGGYELAKRPEEVTVQDILEAFKDEFEICVSMPEGETSATTLRNFADFFVSAKDEMDKKMSTFSLANLLAEQTIA